MTPNEFERNISFASVTYVGMWLYIYTVFIGYSTQRSRRWAYVPWYAIAMGQTTTTIILLAKKTLCSFQTSTNHDIVLIAIRPFLICSNTPLNSHRRRLQTGSGENAPIPVAHWDNSIILPRPLVFCHGYNFNTSYLHKNDENCCYQKRFCNYKFNKMLLWPAGPDPAAWVSLPRFLVGWKSKQPSHDPIPSPHPTLAPRFSAPRRAYTHYWKLAPVSTVVSQRHTTRYLF